MIWVSWATKFFEWLREPAPPLMASFFPYLEPEANKLLKVRFGLTLPKPFLKTINGYVYFRLDLLMPLKQPQIFLSPVRLLQGLKMADKGWKNEILPAYKRKMVELRQFGVKKASEKELLDYIENILKFEAWIIAHSMFLAIHCMFSERLLRFVYHLLVKDKNWRDYIQLMRGYTNKTIEADQKLWELAQAKGKTGYQKKLDSFIQEYGHRVFDVDVIHPTLAENKSLLNNLIRIYAKVPKEKRPYQLLAQAKKQRLKHEKIAFRNLRLWIPYSEKIFTKILRFSQRYAALRESRPFYHLMAFSLARKALLELGSKIAQLEKPEDIFFLTYPEIQTLVKNPKASKKEIREKIKRRKNLREKQKKKQPPEFVKE